MQKKLYDIQLKIKDKVTTPKGTGFITGEVSEIRESIQAGRKLSLYVIRWEDGAVETYPNGTVQISLLKKV